MVKTYIAINGDDVGHRIGQAIASDNHEDLKSASEGIKQSHGMIEEWVQAHGGEVVSSSGDEGIYCVPEEALQELEQIRSDYKNMSGHALTVGVGNSMSEASKALIYGKLNGKNQVVHYEPQLEDYISGEDEEEIPDEATEEMPAEEMEQAPAEGEIPSEEDAQEQADLGEAAGAGVEDPQAQEEQAEAAAESGEEIGSKHPQEPEHEEDMSAEAEMEHDAFENEEDEKDADNIEADAEQGEDEGLDGMVEGEDFGTDPDDGDVSGEVDPEQIPMDEEQAAPQEGAGESPYDDVAPDTENPADEEQTAEGEEGYDYNNALSDMIHGHMEGEEEQGDPAMEGEQPPMEEGMEDPAMQEEGAIPEEGMEDEMAPEQDQDAEMHDELKEDIRTALSIFKQNKDMLEQARSASPEMYEATVTMLRAMIEMSKILGYGPEQDIADQEAQDGLVDEFPDASAEEEGEQPPVEGEEEEELEEIPTGKKQ